LKKKKQEKSIDHVIIFLRKRKDSSFPDANELVIGEECFLGNAF